MPQDSLFLLRLSIKKLEATVLTDIWPLNYIFHTLLGVPRPLVLSVCVFRTSSNGKSSNKGMSGPKTAASYEPVLSTSGNLAHMMNALSAAKRAFTNFSQIWIRVPFERDLHENDRSKSAAVATNTSIKRTATTTRTTVKISCAYFQATYLLLEHIEVFSVSVKIYTLYSAFPLTSRYTAHPLEKSSKADLLPAWRAVDVQGGYHKPREDSNHSASNRVSSAFEDDDMVVFVVPIGLFDFQVSHNSVC
ncbi:hypothetical protein NEOLEDRAFT_1147371 [Neolentinus lepideus HHB14362 ss-1]|uniref:Uncharacterized protein n=1 Tax=Neolentinus lepideus HHB14362 ss-1 TaxID=1314782 RepID=A0A165T964_9AGAM|nr:hypothetical protein NEOLEDRAFT_1147371 [Neolentinus lepideus HHB14362 ss-1]